MPLKKIVVATDFSPQAQVALVQALNVARLAGAELVLVHATSVVNLPAVIPESMHGAIERYGKLMRDNLDETRGRLERLREEISGQGVAVSQMVVDGFPDTGIRDAAHELEADLVVTGTHGRTGLGRLLLGSVAERVVRLCETNVMVARGEATASGGYRRIMVATDFSDLADRALASAMELVAAGGTVDLVHFWQLPNMSSMYEEPQADHYGDARSLLDAIAAHANEQAEERRARYHREGVNLNFYDVQGAATHCIHERLEAEPYDLIALGSHGRRGVRRLLLGSVAEATVRHANCSVLVVHAPRQPEEV